jgi:DHA1 family inner membrane transport protein
MSATLTATDKPTVATTQYAAIFALSLGAFAIGTSEFMISGLLQDLSADLAISIPTAGMLISGYGLGVAIGGPLTTIAISGLGRKNQVHLLLAIFILGNLVCAAAGAYGPLLFGRVISACCHGAFYGIASVIAGNLVPAGRRARAIALVSAGVMVANVFGVPLGTAVGQAFGWRTAFWGVSAIGAAATLAAFLFVPADEGRTTMKLSAEVGALIRPAVLLGLTVCLLFTTGLFCLFAYVTPLLTTVSGAAPSEIPTLLVLFGAGATVGVIGGGFLADRLGGRAIQAALAGQIAAYAGITLFCDTLAAMYVLVFVIGLVGMGAVAPLKATVLNAAFDAPALTSTLTSSALNLGVAVGSTVGALMLSHGLGYGALPLAGIVAAAAAIGVAGIQQKRATLR